MRRGVVHTGAWAVATGAAVSLSWLGVHSVLRDPGAGTAAVAVSAAPTTPRPLPPTIGYATHRAAPRTPSPTSPSARPSRSPSPSPSPTAAGSVSRFQIRGGRVAVWLGPNSASLVSATANPGWSMHVYRNVQWFRVDFQQGTSDSALFVTWNGHPPMVTRYEA